MINWVKATYSSAQVQDKAYITTLDYVGTNGRYNVYQMVDGRHIVIFNNQGSLLDYVSNRAGSIFLVRFLHENDNKHSYKTEVDGLGEVTVLTLARVATLIQGTAEHPRVLSTTSDTLESIIVS